MAARQFGAKREARKTVRRLVDLECGVFAELWGEAITHRVIDVSEEGLWIETDLLLDIGTFVTLTFYPPDWDEPLFVAGRVQRVQLRKGSRDSGTIGMGIEFEALRTDERRRLTRSMRCLRAQESFILDQRTLTGVPVGAADPPKPLPDPQRTVVGWAAPAPAPSRPMQTARPPEEPATEPVQDSPAFRGGIDLATSVFDGVRSD